MNYKNAGNLINSVTPLLCPPDPVRAGRGQGVRQITRKKK